MTDRLPVVMLDPEALADGQYVLTVSDGKFSAVATGGGAAMITAYKTADETVTNSTTLQNDDHLSVPIAANEVMIVTFKLFATSPAATGDFKCTVGVPAGATVRNTAIIGPALTVGATESSLKDQSFSSAVALSAGVPAAGLADVLIVFEAAVENGATAGSITLQWAQNTASPSGTTIERGSNAIGYVLA